jgi:8-oxo-dGTP diphosphatase
LAVFRSFFVLPAMLSGVATLVNELTDDPEVEREYPSSPLVGVGAIITDGERTVLVRRAKPPSAGEWSIPGGLVHVGEALKDAVIREALEETGLKVEPVCLVELLDRIFCDELGRVQYHYVLADYLCQVVDGVLSAGSDAAEAKWAYRSELPAMEIAPVTVKVILKAMDTAPAKR